MHRTGGPSVLKLEEAALPPLKPGQVVVQVHAASVNPVDTKIRSGTFRFFKARLPAILGRDVSGVVAFAGKGAGLRIGDPVFGMLDYERGAYAEYAPASRRELAPRPAGVSDREASTLGVAALTAWQCLFDHGRLRRGQRVLIHGAAGGVGHFAVQFARLRGATVIATAGRRDLRWVRSLGAHQVIDYKGQRFEEETSDIDLVVDLIAGETQDRSWSVLRRTGGAMVSTLAEPSRAQARKHHARVVRMVVEVDRRQLAQIAALVAAGKVRATLGRVFPLAKARAAHELVEDGHVRGKVVLDVLPAQRGKGRGARAPGR